MTAIVLDTKISEVENKIPNTSGLVTTTVLNTKISEIENEVPNHDKYIATPKFNKFTSENVTATLKQANLMIKTGSAKNLTSVNRNITSNKAKHFIVQKKINSLITNDYNFFFKKMYFTSNDRSQNTFAYQSPLDTFESKKDKGTDYVLS